MVPGRCGVTHTIRAIGKYQLGERCMDQPTARSLIFDPQTADFVIYIYMKATMRYILPF